MNSNEELLVENYRILHESVQNSHQYAWTLTNIFVPLTFASLAFLFKSAEEIDKYLFLVISFGIVATLLFWVFAIRFLENCNKLRFHKLKHIEKALSSLHSENEDTTFIYYQLFERNRRKFIVTHW